MDTTLQCSPRSGPQGAEHLAGAIVEAMPVVVAHQLRTLGAHQRRHALRDDFTLGYLFGLLYGLSRQLPEAARERFLLSVAAPTFCVVYDGDGTAMLERSLGGLAALNPRMLGGSRAGAQDARSWMSGGARTMRLETEFSMPRRGDVAAPCAPAAACAPEGR